MKSGALQHPGWEHYEVDVEPTMRQLMAQASLEATPSQVLGLEAAPEWLMPGTRVYVPFLPKSRFEETLAACERLQQWGMVAIPHIPARAVPGEAQLSQWLASLVGLGVYHILLIAGERATPAGPFANTLALLASGILAQFPLQGIGVAGHPEGHPVATLDELSDALIFKREYAEVNQIELWIVTQFSFDPETVIHWLESYCELLGPVPVYLGMPGPTRLKNLLFYAAQCGVVASMAALRRNMNAAQLLKPWTPAPMVEAMARYQMRNPATPFRGIHLFPFGGLKQSAYWLQGKH